MEANALETIANGLCDAGRRPTNLTDASPDYYQAAAAMFQAAAMTRIATALEKIVNDR